MKRREQRFPEVTPNNLFRIANRRQVGLGVPFQEHIQVGRKLVPQKLRGKCIVIAQKLSNPFLR